MSTWRRWKAYAILALPIILYLLTPLIANRIEPRICGIPFILSYVFVVTMITGPLVVLAAKLDRRGDDHRDDNADE